MYGVYSHILLQRYAANHHLKINDSVPVSECLRVLLDIWVEHEHLPLYHRGSGEQVVFNVGIQSKDILNGHCDLDFEIDKSDLEDFLRGSELPFPAPGSEKENSFWFYDDNSRRNTKYNNLESMEKFRENADKVDSLERKKEEIELAPGLDVIKRQERLEKLNTEIVRINNKID